MSLQFSNSPAVCTAVVLRKLLGFLLISTGLIVLPAPTFAQATISQMSPESMASSPVSRPTPSTATLVKSGKAPASASVAALPKSFSSLDWNSLTAAQHNALKPLSTSWTNLSDGQKRKWITLSANYPQMSADEQTKLHGRMAQWAALSPLQREQARLNFAETKQITPQQKTEKWQAYQALSPEEKQKLAKSAQPKPPRTALAAQPAASDKISRMPVKKTSGGIALSASAPSLSKNTLLVKPKPPKLPIPPKAPTSAVIHGISAQ
jgi:hypothetical protein